MWLNKKESEKGLDLIQKMFEEMKESHNRELFLQKQFINVAQKYPQITDDYKYCDICSMFHYPGQHIKKETGQEEQS